MAAMQESRIDDAKMPGPHKLVDPASFINHGGKAEHLASFEPKGVLGMNSYERMSIDLLSSRSKRLKLCSNDQMAA